MVVTWNSILLNEVDSEEEAFREIRRFIDASQLPAQTVHIEEGFVCDDTDIFSHREQRHLRYEDKKYIPCKQVCVNTTWGVYGLPSFGGRKLLTFLICHVADRREVRYALEFRSKEQFLKYYKPLGRISEFELSQWRKNYELLYSMLENYLITLKPEKEGTQCR